MKRGGPQGPAICVAPRSLDTSPLGLRWTPLRSRLPTTFGWVFEDQAVTLATMCAAANDVAALLAHGVSPGDRVAIWLPNRLEWAASLFACAKLGALLVALNTRWKSHEVGHVLTHAQPCVLIMQRHLLNIDFEVILDEALSDGAGALTAPMRLVEVDGVSLKGAIAWTDFVHSGVTIDQSDVECCEPRPVPYRRRHGAIHERKHCTGQGRPRATPEDR